MGHLFLPFLLPRGLPIPAGDALEGDFSKPHLLLFAQKQRFCGSALVYKLRQTNIPLKAHTPMFPGWSLNSAGRRLDSYLSAGSQVSDHWHSKGKNVSLFFRILISYRRSGCIILVKNLTFAWCQTMSNGSKIYEKHGKIIAALIPGVKLQDLLSHSSILIRLVLPLKERRPSSTAFILWPYRSWHSPMPYTRFHTCILLQ